MVIFIVLVVAIILFLLGYSLKLFRIERVEDRQLAASRKEAAAAEPETVEEEEEKEVEQEEELVNLVEYFGGSLEPEEKEQPRETEAEAPIFDKLTGFFSGRRYASECDKALEAAFEAGDSFAVVCFDIDRFRFINSVKGYSLGDYVLTHLAQNAARVFPEGALLTRVSADHFVAAFSFSESPPYEEYDAEIRRVCERIRMDVAIKSSMRICMGIAHAEPSQGRQAYNMGVLLAKANLSRHCLKVSRSENFSLYNDSVATSLLYGESALEDYNENQYADEIVLYFQPLSDLGRNVLGGSEALTRWVCLEGTAELSIPEEEQIPTNGIKVFYQVCKTMSRWRKAGKELLPMYLRIPETEFLMSDLDGFFVKCLSEFQLESGFIRAVVDVSTILLNKSVARDQIKKLCDVGIAVGVGGIDISYESLDFLEGLPLSFVKFRRNVVQDIHKNPDKENLARKLLASSSKLQLQAVMEGVDGIEQLKAVQRLKAAFAEGKGTGRMVQADDFLRMMGEYSQMYRGGDATVILSETDFKRGDFNL